MQHMCSKFVVAAAKVLNNETLMLPSLQVRSTSGSDAGGDVEKLVVGEYMDSHGLNGALQAIAVRHLLLAACLRLIQRLLATSEKYSYLGVAGRSARDGFRI